MNLPASDRAALATALQINDQYLYQCLTGRRALDPADAVRLEQLSHQRIRRWHVRHRDWHLIWPELIGIEGAPAIKADDCDSAQQAALIDDQRGAPSHTSAQRVPSNES